MKIGVIHPHLHFVGGEERVAVTLANGLTKLGYDVSIASIKKSSFKLHHKVNQYFNPLKLQIKPVTPLLILAALKMFIKFRPKILFFTKTFRITFYLLPHFISRFFKIPMIFYCHNYFQKPTLLDRTLGVRMLLKARNVITNSHYMRKSLRKAIGINMMVIYPPVNLSKLKPDWPKKENIILYLSRYDPEKKQEEAVNLFKKLESQYNGEIKLIFAGSTNFPESKRYYNKIKTMTQGSKNILLFKNLKDEEILELLQKSKIFWFLRRDEHFGITVVEAMACGTVPVVLRNGGICESIIDKETGFLCESENQLIQKTKLLFDDEELWQSLAKSGVQRADFFGNKNFVKHCENLIKRAL